MNDRQKNIVSRARQLKEIRWTSLKEIVVKGTTGKKTVVNQVYHGVPYCGNASTKKYVGFNVSLEEFAEKSKNINSQFYSNNTVWGTDCSGFVSYAWGIERHWTGNIGNSNYAEKVGFNKSGNARITMDDIEILQSGDWLNGDGHAVLVAYAIHNSIDNSLKRIVTFEYRPITGNDNINIMVFDSSVPVANKNEWSTYSKDIKNGYAAPIEAFVFRLNDSDRSPYNDIYRLKNDTECASYVPSKVVPIYPEEVEDDYENHTYITTPVIRSNVSYSTWNKVRFSWTATNYKALDNIGNINNSEKSYIIYYSQTEGGTYSKVDETTNTYYETSLLKDGYYKVQAVIKESNVGEHSIKIYSCKSAPISVTKAHQAPSNFTASRSNRTITLKWSAPDGGGAYSLFKIYRKGADNSEYSLMTMKLASQTESDGTYKCTWTEPIGSKQKQEFKICAYYNGKDVGYYSYTFVYAEDGILGDANKDMVVDSADATHILRYVANLVGSSSISLNYADVDCNGTVDASDSTLILRYVAKKCTIPIVSVYAYLNTEIPDGESPVSVEPIAKAPRKNNNNSLEFVAETIANGKIKVDVFVKDNISNFSSIQFRIDWNEENFTITDIKSYITAVTNYDNNEGWFILAAASAENIELNDERKILTFIFDSETSDFDDIDINLSDFVVYN